MESRKLKASAVGDRGDELPAAMVDMEREVREDGGKGLQMPIQTAWNSVICSMSVTSGSRCSAQ